MNQARTDRNGHSGVPPRGAAILVYVVLTIVMTWPLIRYLGTHFMSPDTDVFVAYWGNWWVPHALSTGRNPYLTDHLMYPAGFNLIAFAFSPLMALAAIPLGWILPPITTYNLLVLATIVLCSVAMDQLVRYLTGNAWAALIAGITFGFAPAAVAVRGPDPSLAALFWIPWAALLLTRLMRDARVRDAVLLPVTIGLAFLTKPQVAALTLLFCGIYLPGLAWVERKRWHRLAIRRLLLAGLLPLLILSPFLFLAWQAVQQPGGESIFRSDAEHYQADLLAYVVPPQDHPLLGFWTETIHQERFGVNRQYWSYVGIVPLFLLLYAALSRPRKALPLLLTGLMLFVLALGPYLRFNGQAYEAIKLPYGLVAGLFSVMGLNWPNRINLALMVAVSALVGLACARIYARSKKAWILGLIALLVVSEYLVIPLPVALAPPHSVFYDQMAADGEDYAIVDLPLARDAGEVHLYYQTFHHKPIVGGWTPRVPTGAFALIDANPLLATWRGTRQPGVTLEGALAQLSEANVRHVMVHKQQIASVPEEMRFLLSTLRPVYQDRNILVLPVQTESSQGYNIVHRFSDSLALIHPTVFIDLPLNKPVPQLSAYICWFLDGLGHTADEYQVTLTGPDGSLVFKETAPLPRSWPGLSCAFRPLEFDPPPQAGVMAFHVTPLSAGEPLGTYTLAQPIHVLRTRRGDAFSAMGSVAHVGFDEPFEMLGYSLTAREGSIWVDLFWRSTANHQKTHFLWVHLLNPETGQSVVSEEGLIGKYDWKEGDLFQERRILWLDDVAPGQYALGVALDATPIVDDQGASLLPGGVVMLDVAVRVLPAGLWTSPLP
jgi:hypothetical protein